MYAELKAGRKKGVEGGEKERRALCPQRGSDSGGIRKKRKLIT